MDFRPFICCGLCDGSAPDWHLLGKLALASMLCAALSDCSRRPTGTDVAPIPHADLGHMSGAPRPTTKDAADLGDSAADCSHVPAGGVALAATDRATVHPACFEFGLCPFMGRCTYFPGQAQCFAGSDADCRLSEQCKIWGDCDFMATPQAGLPPGAQAGYCEALANSECSKHRACGLTGRCGKVGVLCKATVEAHCLAALSCKLRGQCTLSDGHCAATTDQHCAASVGCRSEGRCHLWTHPQHTGGNRCVPLSNKDCEQSSECKLNEACVLDTHLSAGTGEQFCGRAKQVDCKVLPLCAQEGRCLSSEGACLVADDASCQQSAACLVEGRCWKGPLHTCDYHWPTWKAPKP